MVTPNGYHNKGWPSASWRLSSKHGAGECLWWHLFKDGERLNLNQANRPVKSLASKQRQMELVPSILMPMKDQSGSQDGNGLNLRFPVKSPESMSRWTSCRWSRSLPSKSSTRRSMEAEMCQMPPSERHCCSMMLTTIRDRRILRRSRSEQWCSVQHLPQLY